MRNEAMTIGVTPSQAAKQRWLNSFAMTAFYTYIDRIGDSLKKAGKDKTNTVPQQLFRLCFYDLEKGEYKNLINYLNDGSIEVTVTLRQKPDSLNR